MDTKSPNSSHTPLLYNASPPPLPTRIAPPEPRPAPSRPAMHVFRAKVPVHYAAKPQSPTSTWRNALGFSWRLRARQTNNTQFALELSIKRTHQRCATMLSIWLAIRHPVVDTIPIENVFVGSTTTDSPPKSCPDVTRFVRVMFPAHVAAEVMAFRPFPTGFGSQLRRHRYIRDGHLTFHLTVLATPISDHAILPNLCHYHHNDPPISLSPSCPAPSPLRRQLFSEHSSTAREQHDTTNLNDSQHAISWLDHHHPDEHLWPLNFDNLPHFPQMPYERFHTDISSYTELLQDEQLQCSTDDHSSPIRVSYSISSLLRPNFSQDDDSQQGSSTNRETNFADVELHVGSAPNLKLFRLHRCILALASPIFRAMLTIDMQENSTGKVELPNFSSQSISFIIRHIYGENIDGFPPDLAFEIYCFGHQFEIASLLSVARLSILRTISAATVVDVLCFGRTYADSTLSDRAHAYIAHNFSTMASSSTILEKLCQLPADAMYRLLESDHIRATELEVLLVSLRWLAQQKGVIYTEGILRRIRWSLMTPDMLDTALSAKVGSLSRKFEAILLSSTRAVADAPHTGGMFEKRRFLGRPTATLWIPLIRKPPKVAKLRCREKRPLKCERLQFSYPTNVFQAKLARHVETTFEHASFKWSFRAQMLPCGAWGCDEPRLSVSLWLEEDDEGTIWTRDGAINSGTAILPLRVVARCMVWNARGGQLHSRTLDVVFRSAGWACGWSIQDLLDGHERTCSFMSQLSTLKHEESKALQVAIEICECSPVDSE